ncbi:hypothetical protein QQ008_16885 [Fulvivirgaceae bacterium BMA10]|uniref:Uncharacterized protein n=1 Tax=Splendidivirga corallicola TaxID=3051826 RepID=A0ABT8KQN3_9BACT|nr:hypothetical protein [Fulvivirgaceae bacterium BMA10]
MTGQEKKNSKTGLIVSLTIHGALLLLFIFLLAWRPPNPPLPEYGIEINFGLDDAGTGEIQPEVPPVETKSIEEPQPEESSVTEEVVEEEVVEETVEEPVEEVVEEVVTETPVVQPKEDPVVEEKKKVEPQPKKIEKVEEKKPEPVKKEPVKEVKKDGGNDGQGKSDTAKEKSHGDKENTTGDQGKKEGTLDSRTLYGNQGGGNGPRLDLPGWRWDRLPDPNDNSNEGGRIVFQIKVDDEGEIVSVITLEKTVSPAIERIYKQEVERLTFSPTSNARPPAISTGKITFIIKSQ